MSQSGPTFGGIVSSLTSLFAPDAFVSASPAAAGIRYRSLDQRGVKPLADVYLPEGSGPFPPVLLVHGGGFVLGSRAMKPMRYLATRLSGAGFAVASVDYRMIFRGGRIRHAVADVNDALDWWVRQTDFPIQGTSCAVLGLSAGATLAHLVAAQNPGRVHKLVSFFGVYDFDTLGGPLGTLLHRFLFEGDAPGDWSPLGRLAQLEMPIHYLHGTADNVVPVQQAHDMVTALRSNGHEAVDLHLFHGLPHGFLNQPDHPQALNAVEVVLEALRGR